ncbi:hypothetical protein HNP40_003141 [Mycobacteroides chelonae]|nr:hypothetical protein [Mycobacteroides chelonae]
MKPPGFKGDKLAALIAMCDLNCPVLALTKPGLSLRTEAPDAMGGVEAIPDLHGYAVPAGNFAYDSGWQ